MHIQTEQIEAKQIKCTNTLNDFLNDLDAAEPERAEDARKAVALLRELEKLPLTFLCLIGLVDDGYHQFNNLSRTLIFPYLDKADKMNQRAEIRYTHQMEKMWDTAFKMYAGGVSVDPDEFSARVKGLVRKMKEGF